MNIMKTKLFITILLVVFTSPLTTCLAIDNPVGSGTMPASSGTSGLVRSPNPIDTSGNLLVTGNVSGYKYFRGVVPYSSTSDFGASLGSTSLDSFMRRSAGSTDYGFTSSPTPYFSQTRTVSSIIPGSGGVIRQPTLNSTTQQAGKITFTALPKVYPTPGKDVFDMRFRPLSMTTRQMETVLSSDVENTLQKQRELTDAQAEQLQHDLEQLSDKAKDLKKPFMGQDDSLKQLAKPELKSNIDVSPESVNSIEEAKKSSKTDVYSQMQKRVDDFRKNINQAATAEKPKEVAETEKKAVGKTADKTSSPDKLSSAQISVKAQTIMGEYKTFAAFSDDKFNQYMRAGEDYLKQGKYYLAANAYTVASVYKSSDPLACAGKSHALFAAGEYMSSALFLARTLEMFPEYARFKIDLAAMIGSKDVIETRIADIIQWQQKDEIGELQFLLGYVYYQMNRLDVAKKAIDIASEKMPDSKAVACLKQAIYDAAGK
jgi:tetratricopeptide (TPR) repeat protein